MTIDRKSSILVSANIHRSWFGSSNITGSDIWTGGIRFPDMINQMGKSCVSPDTEKYGIENYNIWQMVEYINIIFLRHGNYIFYLGVCAKCQPNMSKVKV